MKFDFCQNSVLYCEDFGVDGISRKLEKAVAVSVNFSGVPEENSRGKLPGNLLENHFLDRATCYSEPAVNLGSTARHPIPTFCAGCFFEIDSYNLEFF